MPPQRDPGTDANGGAGSASSLGGPILAIGAFAAGVAATFVAKRLLGARHKADDARDKLDVGSDGPKEDLATVLRRAALDVAVVATGQAAERLRSQGEESETEVEPDAEAVESSSR